MFLIGLEYELIVDEREYKEKIEELHKQSQNVLTKLGEKDSQLYHQSQDLKNSVEVHNSKGSLLLTYSYSVSLESYTLTIDCATKSGFISTFNHFSTLEEFSFRFKHLIQFFQRTVDYPYQSA